MSTRNPSWPALPNAQVDVISHAIVSEDNLKEIQGVTASEQHAMIDLGDTLSVVFFNNSALGCAGTVTIWHNKHQAAVKTYSSSITGEWLDTDNLVVTDAEEEGWTVNGELVTGCLAMDLNGSQGIYSCGEFYRGI